MTNLRQPVHSKAEQSVKILAVWTRINSKHKTNDNDIRKSLVRKLEKLFPADDENLIIHEFSCDSARVDVAVVNGSLHGYEIKSDQDTVARLENQALAYGQIFDRMTLVIGSSHKPEVVSHVPAWWTVMLAQTNGDEVTLKVVRKGRKNPSRSVNAVARLLWSREAALLLRSKGYVIPHKFRANDLWDMLVEKLEPAELSLEVRDALRARAKSKAVESQIQRGGSYTIESNAPQLRHSENRRWLALQSARLQS